MSELLQKKSSTPFKKHQSSEKEKKSKNSPLSLFSFKNPLTAHLNLKIVSS
jgi:hypothetical protein